MAFAQLTFRESLRDIEACLRAQIAKLYHMGIRARVSRSTLADANEVRDWRIYAEFAQRLIGIARRLYVDEPFGVDLKQTTVYALDSTTIDLCLSVFAWAFGLGFDTASEVGLLAMTAGASAGNLPAAAVLSLPILFAAGMMAMDTTDGVLMSKAYNWAFVNPLRKIFYNITITSLSIAVALIVGTIELLQVFIWMLDLNGRFFDPIAGLDFGIFGYVIVGTFLAAWSVSAAVWKFGRIEERYGHVHPLQNHEHAHDGGLSHSHEHFD